MVMVSEPEEVDLLSQLVATVSKALVSDGTWDAFKVQVMKGGMKVAISVGWPDDEDEDEQETTGTCRKCGAWCDLDDALARGICQCAHDVADHDRDGDYD